MAASAVDRQARQRRVELAEHPLLEAANTSPAASLGDGWRNIDAISAVGEPSSKQRAVAVRPLVVGVDHTGDVTPEPVDCIEFPTLPWCAIRH
jgi:hypothetical protein